LSFFEELKRRNVFRVGVAYVISAWVLLQFSDLVLENIQAPEWVMKVFMLALAIGFPLAVFFAWVFEMTPEGIKKEKDVDRSQSIAPKTGRKLDRSIIVVLLVALTWFAWDRFGAAPEVDAPSQVATTTIVEKPVKESTVEKSVAVLPFVAMSSGPDDEYFADGLTEEILNSLAQLPELLVTARTSSFHFKGQEIPVQEIATTLGVKHIVEGSVRKSGQRLRVTAQLIRAEDGFHLWSENYDSDSEDTIAVQEDIAEKIAQAMDVVMNDEKRKTMRLVGLRDVEAFIAYQKGREAFSRGHGEADQISTLLQANKFFEEVIERVPEFTPAYIGHSDLYFHILLADAAKQVLPNLTEDMRANAYQNAEKDMSTAASYARTTTERNNIEFDLAFLSGNWRGMTGRLQQVLNGKGCEEPNWFSAVVTVSSYIEDALPRIREFRVCDPLTSSNWYSEVRSLLAAGDVSGALDTARQGDAIAPGNWLTIVYVMALVANGQFDEAQNLVADRVQNVDDALLLENLLAAARGDRELLADKMEQAKYFDEVNGLWALLIHAWAGDQQFNNALAAEIDAHPAGPMALTLATRWCSCGAPWDISATPNFAAIVEEARLPWPPATIVSLPLKDW
jgi:adenylate cyclase